jgi:type III secretion protein V
MPQALRGEGGTARRYADAALAAVVVLMVGMMIVPLPTPLLDVLIASNVSVAVLMLLVAMYIAGGLQFTAFPTVLLVTTLYRLALNVSSTRLILLQADAGEVISAFGNFVVQGNYVVGAVVFLILTLIQFLVIAKGSERVAEVGARFTLDAMPGKQMSIDAELRSGALTQEQARAKRHLLQRESQFYGSMDGAMKFVKGDAIAGIVITVVNILGGLAIGVAMRDLSAVEALKTYGLLTIGDGLVSQIPALLISTSAGLVVTRVASEEENASLGRDVATQIFGNRRALGIASVFLIALAVVPGLPALPFVVLGVTFGVASYRLARRETPTPAYAAAAAAEREAARETHARQDMVPLVVPVAVDVGEALADRVLGEDGHGPLPEQELPRLRDQLFLDLGVGLPGVRTRRSSELGPDSYSLSVQEVPVGHGIAPEGRVLALDSDESLAQYGVRGEPTRDPATALPACWVDPASRDELEAFGVQVLDESSLIARHLDRALRRRAHDLVGLQEVQGMLDQLERAYPALVRNVVPKPVSLALLTDVLRRLVEEGVSIRSLREILESLATYAPNEKDPVALTELVRTSLRRQITARYARGGVLSAHLLDPDIEEAIRESIQRTSTGSYLAMAPDLARDVIDAVRRQCPQPSDGSPIVLLTQSDVRRYARRLLEVELGDLVVLGYQELAPEVTVQPLGRVSL